MDSAFDLASIDFLCTTYDDVPLTAFCPFNDYFSTPVGMPSHQTTYHAAFPSNVSYQSSHEQFDDVTVKPDPSFENDYRYNNNFKMSSCSSSIDASKNQNQHQQNQSPHKLIFKELNITQPNGVVSPADLLNFINSSTYQPHRISTSLKTAQKPTFSQTFVQTVNTSNIKNFQSPDDTSHSPSTTWQTKSSATVSSAPSSNCIIDQLLKSHTNNTNNNNNTCNQSCCQRNNNNINNSAQSNAYFQNNDNSNATNCISSGSSNNNNNCTPPCNSATTTVISSSEIDISSAAVQNYLSLFNNNTKNGVNEKHGYMSNSMSDNDSTDSFCDISEYLHLPQNKAAKKLQIPASTLSKRWKEASMNKKWPYRDIRKIDKEIEAVVHALNSSSASSSPSPTEAVEENNQQLAALLRKRKEFMRPIFIRLSM